MPRLTTTTLLRRADTLLARLETLLPTAAPTPVLKHPVWRWHEGHLQSFALDNPIHLQDLLGLERQKQLLETNTRQFLAGLPANNALLWGSRGTGKSSLVRALLTDYAAEGLRLVEVSADDLLQLPTIAAELAKQPLRFIIYADDLSFGADDQRYTALKSLLDGSLSGIGCNTLIYATSNRRHLLPEYQSENHQTHLMDTELHHGEAVEEKVSLSERFGLWLSFHPFKQDEYLAIVRYWLLQLGCHDDEENYRAEALRWALQRGSRSGRVGWQFACHWAGQRQLQAIAHHSSASV